MALMCTRSPLPVLLVTLGLSACMMQGAGEASRPGGTGQAPAGTAQPSPPIPGQPAPAERPAAPPARQFRLGAAASALVTQAQHQASGGDYAAAAVTLE